MSTYKSFKSWSSYCIHVTGLPIFFLLFVFLFNPALIGETSFSEFYGDYYTLSLMVLTLIVAASTAVLRVIFTFLCRLKSFKLEWFSYTLWCLLEIVVTSQFMSLYTSLILDIHYMNASTVCLRCCVCILVFPYAIIGLSLYNHELGEQVNQHYQEDEPLARFQDENKKLKLVIAPSAILYLKSDENYVNISYLEGGKVKTFVLRASMKSLEPVIQKHHLVRCHRSYVVNPAHVTILKKESDGSITAELDDNRVDPIPVSRRYYDALSELL